MQKIFDKILSIKNKYKSSIVFDTRNLKKNDIFVGIKTKKNDGSFFYNDALKKKAGLILINNPKVCHQNILQINKIDNSHLEAIENVYYRDFENAGFSWETIEENLSETVSLLKDHIFGINGDIKDVIDEEKYEKGLVSIRIGGDKLSRGLTLPGLMVSYFLRTSRMYDTLMQMGRWFGYRDGYEDLCRIFTTGRLYNWYGHISFASEGLRRRIQQMNLRYLLIIFI